MWSIYGLIHKIYKNEKGQALPIVLAALALGALVVGPFLSQASSSLIGSRTYGTVSNESYSADAGVEHGIWRLAYNGLAAQLPNVGNNLSYQLPNQVNGVAASVMVTNTQAAGTPIGGITEPVVDTFEFDTTACYKPKIIKISGSVYAVVYTGPTNYGYVKTFTIAANGSITKTAIDTWTFDTTACYEPDIINISGTVYAIIYRGPSNNGYLKTITIANNGAITKTAIGTSNFGTALYEPDFMLVSGTNYVIIFRNATGAGYLRTVRIATNGNISNPSQDSWNFASAVYEPRIMNISGNVYGFVYRGASNACTVMTDTISTTGAITKTAIGSWAFDTTGYTPMIIRISGNVYAVTYRGTANAGFTKTMTISTAGAITKTAISSLNFDTTGGYEPFLLYVAGTVYACTYRNASNQGTAKTYEILTNGQITQTIIDSMQFDATAGYEPGFINVGTGIYAVAYRGPSNGGYLKTIGIAQSASTGTLTYSVQSTANGTTITATVTINGTAAAITSWVVQRQ